MTDIGQEEVDRLMDLIEATVRDYPEGISEFDLFTRLRGDGEGTFKRCEDGAIDANLDLFQRHFLLFHILYKLRARIRRHGEGDLEIHCLKIRWRAERLEPEPLLAADATQGQLKAIDPLQAYYEDLTNLSETTEEDVHELLDDFWRRLDRGSGDRGEALATLGLEDPVDGNTIKKRFHALAFEHHPDRGGDAGIFAKLSAAMRTLEN